MYSAIGFYFKILQLNPQGKEAQPRIIAILDCLNTSENTQQNRAVKTE